MQSLKNKILVAIDFEEQSLNALNQSYHLAKIFDAEIVLLYCIEPIKGLSKFIFPDNYINKIVANAREKFDEIESLAKKTEKQSRTPVSSIIVKGKAYEKIIEIAKDYGVILIVMGKNSLLERQNRKFVGSNTFNVIREAPCPVISIKGSNLSGAFNNLLLPLDFSKDTTCQINTAIDIGTYFGATINIFSVFPKENKVFRILRQVNVNQAKKSIQKRGLNCNVDIVNAKNNENIAQTIVDFSKEINADMIIIMTQQKRVFVDFFVGSTAQDVINNAGIPVLTLLPIINFKPAVVSSFVDPLDVMRKKEN
ncbi:MAG: universal stress protein [Bacteroidota bacterium]